MISKKGIFVLGFRKCGTTNVYDILSKQWGYTAPSIKEPQFFALDSHTIAEHIDWYKAIYKDSEWILDGSTLYIHDPKSLQKIENHFLDKSYIVCLRDPAKRFYSAYWHMKVKGDAIEKRSLDQVIATYEAIGTITMDKETELINDAHKNGELDLDYLGRAYHKEKFKAGFETKILDDKAFFRYWGESRYSHYLSQIEAPYLTLCLEQLLKNPTGVIAQVENYSGIKGLSKSLPSNRNKTVYRPKWAEPLRKVLGKQTKAFLKTKLGKSSPKIDEKTYYRIRKLLEKEYDLWFDKKPMLKNYWTWQS